MVWAEGLGGNARASRAWKGAMTLKMCIFSVIARFQTLDWAVLFYSLIASGKQEDASK
jgi:hypothetical protein